ncbi:hypothetical protein GH714_028601 [Hevea brasiliensis]|uniref:Uncharacterized protein n=1 Tax=Hevea brasiliensis TaxID=3981 RepID=A0A6A6LJN9_HEVBR|nr:hypothetical protein GH714_028601 [Hevea brasiliensis]
MGPERGKKRNFIGRRRVKEIEEIRELEKKAKELPNKAEDSESEDREEAEEGKKMRVRKELEKQLEKQEPNLNIRRQAADLLYILEAPKLKISQEEMVVVPLIGSS